jgi:membrane-bound inhibitor of C-type lysozyme
MSIAKLFTASAAVSLLAACATMQPPTGPAPAPVAVKAPEPAPVPVPAPAPVQEVAPAFSMYEGTYRCELSRKVVVREVSPDQSLAVLNWRKRDYTMHAVHAPSGALRYEHESGLTWITVVGKSMLLDTKRGKQLANECRV